MQTAVNRTGRARFVAMKWTTYGSLRAERCRKTAKAKEIVTWLPTSFSCCPFGTCGSGSTRRVFLNGAILRLARQSDLLFVNGGTVRPRASTGFRVSTACKAYRAKGECGAHDTDIFSPPAWDRGPRHHPLHVAFLLRRAAMREPRVVFFIATKRALSVRLAAVGVSQRNALQERPRDHQSCRSFAEDWRSQGL